MCDVYKSAKTVVVYLGENSDGLDKAIGLLKALHLEANRFGLAGDQKSPAQIRGELPPKHWECWDRLHEFFSRPWFGRMWVIQEVVVSSADPVVICGPFTLSWTVIARVSVFM